ncbi:PecA family PE domain-processing aspartic protease [Mycolicibacterium komossense]|uniref:PecA family PE domain-processing aspartic protease n=1 Tax=Mycolicibacterium komossense TaxID=1779 RepID=A0ABT3CL32_9MYCO|nr:PecA family PE domain-processing aspartic protease [Mycolicibacterium komossense]MCV7230135.1 PecA family PE domain-processing aspartic protease [Mycolicibacterium komossense]
MAQKSKTTAGGRHRKPSRVHHSYGWLGAGAVTLGIGAALASGSAVAAADSGQSGGSGAGNSTSSTKPAVSATHSRGPARTVSSSTAAVSAGPAKAVVAAAPSSSSVPSSAKTTAAPLSRASHAVLAKPKPTAGATTTSDAAAATDGYGDTSYLPDNQVIVPGAAVKLALQQIADAQQVLQAQTWGTGNVIAGLVSLVPQAILAQSALSLTTWQNSIEGAQTAVANTVNIPIAHELAELSLIGTLLLPSVAGVALDVAALTTPLVGLFGAPAAAAEASALIGQAKQNGQVYAVRLMRTVETTQQIVYLSVNGGPMVPVLLDSGSSGLSILGKYVGQENLGPATGSGSSGYGDDTISVRYYYHTYNTTIDFGGGAVTAPVSVMVVDPGSEAVYDNYGHASAGFVGVLGIGANPGGGTTPNALLPGELKDGIMVYQNILGPFGLVVFGPNPLPSRASVAGASIGNFQVKINDGPSTLVRGNIDSGGVNGNFPASVAGSAADGTGLKPGTRVSVYTADGLTLLYTYTITASNSPTIYDDSTAEASRPNTGNIPFQQGPIYLDYSTPGGLGTTYFDFL